MEYLTEVLLTLITVKLYLPRYSVRILNNKEKKRYSIVVEKEPRTIPYKAIKIYKLWDY